MRVVFTLASITLVACGLSVRGDDETPLTGGTPRPGDAGVLDATVADIDDGAAAQVDLRSAFDVDIVLNRHDGVWDPVQDAMDGSGYVLVTSSADRELYGRDSPSMLPDNAFFDATEAHAAVQLGWRNDNDGVNARLLHGAAPEVVVPLSPVHCKRIVLYGVSVEGTSTLDVTVRYGDDAAPTTATRTFTDWASNAPPADGFLLAPRVHRASVARQDAPEVDPGRGFSVAGIRVVVDAQRPITEIRIRDRETGYPRLYLLGIGLE